MKKKDLTPDFFYKKIKAANWEGNIPFYSNRYQEIKIQMRPNNSVEPGIFKPDPTIPNGWMAHPQTINAVRKDIFVADDDFEELEILYECDGCKKTLDLQFWIRCPYCNHNIPDHFEKISCN
jgi:hypothetical protein